MLSGSWSYAHHLDTHIRVCDIRRILTYLVKGRGATSHQGLPCYNDPDGEDATFVSDAGEATCFGLVRV